MGPRYLLNNAYVLSQRELSGFFQTEIRKKQKNVYAIGQREDRSPRAKQRIIQIDRIFAPNATAPVLVEDLTLCWTNPTEEKLKLDSTRCPDEKGRPGFQLC